MPRPKPMTFQVRPLTSGINTSDAPTSIDLRETPSSINTRFSRGLLALRNGFKRKYAGADEAVLWIDTLYSGGFTNVIAITAKAAYYLDSATESLKLMSVWNGLDSPNTDTLDYPYFSMENLVSYISIDVGEGTYDFIGANGGNSFPSSDATIADLLVLVNGTTDGVIVFAYTGSDTPYTPAEGEVISPDTHPGVPAGGRSVAIFDNRIFIGGDENEPSTITWSAKMNFHQWDAANGGGYRILGDSPDWIQAMKRLGEYLIVYKERSIYIGSTTGLVDPPVRFDAAPGQGIGLASPNSIGDLGEEHIFLGWDNVYVFSVRQIKAVGAKVKDEMFHGSFGILPEFVSNCTGIIAEEFGEYWLFVPTGRWPAGTAEELELPEVANLFSNPAFNQAISTEWSLGSATRVEESADSLFGINHAEIAAGGSLGQGGLSLGNTTEYSCVVWAWADVADSTMTISIRDASGTELTSEDYTLSTSTARYVFSFTVTGGDQVVFEAPAAATLSLDAAHLVPLTGVDDIYIYTETNGYKSVGFLDAYDQPQPIPLISRAVGSYLPDTVWVYNYDYDAWTAWRLPMTGFGYDSIQNIITIDAISGTVEEQNWRFDEKRIEALAPTNLIGQPDGQIYELKADLLYDWDGVMPTPVIGYWESKDFDLDAPHIDKTLSRLLIYHSPEHPINTVTVGASTDGGANWIEQDVDINVGGTYTIADFFVTGAMVRFRIRGGSPGFFIEGFGVKIIPRGEAHAY